MASMAAIIARCLVAGAAVFAVEAAGAADSVGQVKIATGTVAVERDGKTSALAVGDRVFQSDTIVTKDGMVGITFADNSMMSLGPQSRLSLDEFKFDTTTQNGTFNSSLQKGTLTVKSGQIVKQTPEAMHVRTPAALLGVRGTEFAVRADAP